MEITGGLEGKNYLLAQDYINNLQPKVLIHSTVYLDQAVLILLQVFLSKGSKECSVLLDRSEIDRYNAGARLEGKASSGKAKSKKSKQVVVYISEDLLRLCARQNITSQ